MRARSTITMLTAAAAGSALMFTGGATAAQVDSATGGGQVGISTTGGGPGDTIAFTARGTIDEAQGQLQYVQRNDDGTREIEHGTVTCIDAEAGQNEGDPGYAKISGYLRSGGTFTLYVMDAGEGAPPKGDMVTLARNSDPQSEPSCDFDTPTTQWDLGRGNVQVRPGA